MIKDILKILVLGAFWVVPAIALLKLHTDAWGVVLGLIWLAVSFLPLVCIGVALEEKINQ